MKPQSMTLKIMANKAGLPFVEPGQHIVAKVDMCFAHDAVANVLGREFYKTFGSTAKVWDNERVALFQDHMVPARNLEARNMAMALDKFAKEQDIKYYFPYGKDYGVCHIVMLEQGLALPGDLIVGADSHAVTYGAFNNLATGVGVFDVSNLFATGELWFTVPEIIKIQIDGDLAPGVQAKDIILRLLGDIKMDGASGKAIEWCGSTIENMSIDERTTLCNMVVEAGASNGIMQLNNASREYIKKVAKRPFNEVLPDPDYAYFKTISYRAEEIAPMVAMPHRPDNVKKVEDIRKEEIRLHQIYVGGCTGGKFEDIATFANEIEGKQIHADTQVIIVPATMKIYNRMLDEGITSKLVKLGAVVESPGCKACYGLHGGVTGDDETCLATINRNFIGRMGNPRSKIFLSSPVIAARSAVCGFITDQI